MTKELLAQGRLQHFHSTNISQRENDFNEAQAQKEGWSKDTFRVSRWSFDDLAGVPDDDKYDLMVCNDSFLHSTDRDGMIKEFSRILSTGGVAFFSDILQNPNSPDEDLKAIRARFSESTLGTAEEYQELFKKHKFEEIDVSFRTENLQRHYGLVRYSATGPKREQMLHPETGVTQEFFDKTVAGLDQWLVASAGGHIKHGWFTYRNTL